MLGTSNMKIKYCLMGGKILYFFSKKKNQELIGKRMQEVEW